MFRFAAPHTASNWSAVTIGSQNIHRLPVFPNGQANTGVITILILEFVCVALMVSSCLLIGSCLCPSKILWNTVGHDGSSDKKVFIMEFFDHFNGCVEAVHIHGSVGIIVRLAQ